VSLKNNAFRIEPFGTLPDGKTVNLYTLTNGKQMEVSVINVGGIVQSIKVSDRNGVIEDVVLGFDSLEPYLQNAPYLGAIIGRYGNRIAKGRFTLEGKEYSLPVNNGSNHLHGGILGFDKVYWNIVQRNSSLILTYTSADGEQGYPGTLHCTVEYTLTDENELVVHYTATTDKTTIVNLTQHSYFNLAGSKNNTILDHVLKMEADAFLPINEELIPTGEYRKVKNTPFDFSTPSRVGERIDETDEQLHVAGGYDHCWIVNGKGLRKAAAVWENTSGRTLEVFTTEPGMQLYTGNFLDGTLAGKEGRIYCKRSGFCLETQHFPDSPNHVNFPQVILHPRETYRSTTTFKFGVALT
jgi:aldose 1-epimerase